MLKPNEYHLVIFVLEGTLIKHSSADELKFDESLKYQLNFNKNVKEKILELAFREDTKIALLTKFEKDKESLEKLRSIIHIIFAADWLKIKDNTEKTNPIDLVKTGLEPLISINSIKKKIKLPQQGEIKKTVVVTNKAFRVDAHEENDYEEILYKAADLHKLSVINQYLSKTDSEKSAPQEKNRWLYLSQSQEVSASEEQSNHAAVENCNNVSASAFFSSPQTPADAVRDKEAEQPAAKKQKGNNSAEIQASEPQTPVEYTLYQPSF